MLYRYRIAFFLPIWLILMACDSPAKKPPTTCGDGVLDPGEECDKEQLSVQTCSELGYYGQVVLLSCKPDCTLDLSACTEGKCGDGIIQGGHGEDCDGTNLGDQTCRSLGLGGGTLGCHASCRFDVSGCEITAECGDGIVASPYEACDGDDLNGETCERLGYYGGSLHCTADCRGFDESGCQAEGKCGDSVIQTQYGETCDGTQLGGATCEEAGYYPGTVVCAADCASLDYSGCPGFCGDGTVQADFGEVCDGMELDGKDCVALGFSRGSGALACNPDCTFDTSACVAKSGNADLAELRLDYGRLTPAFSPDVTNYTSSVLWCVSAVTVTALAQDPWALVQVLQTQPISLSEGTNQPILVRVTAENGTQKTYRIVVTRAFDNNLSTPALGTFVFVPAGAFQRDADPANVTSVAAFWMSPEEITRSQWTTVSGGWTDPSDPARSTTTSHPVQNLNWYHAIAFANRVSLREGLAPVYQVAGVDFATLTFEQVPVVDDPVWNAAVMDMNADGYRLPTEMEWMWAAMGADRAAVGQLNTTGYAKPFSGSNGTNLIQNYVIFGYGTGEPGSTTVDRTSLAWMVDANELGIRSLSGNVHELVWDWYGDWPAGALANHQGPAGGILRVRRGGAWNSPSADCSISARAFVAPFVRDPAQGLHLVRSLPPGTCP